MLFITNNHFFYALPLLLKEPKYVCPPEIEHCDSKAYCEDPSNVYVDWTDTWSLENWVQRLNLPCEDPFKVALLGSMYFAGTTALGLFVTRLGDVYGRKWPSRISALLGIPVQIALLSSTNLNLMIILFFLLGAVGPGRCQVGFVYASELLPERYRTILGSAILFADSSSIVVLPIYHRFLSKSWLPFQ